MNNRLYARLAKTNLKKNKQNILPYLLSCIGTMMMFFIMDTLAQGNGMEQMTGSAAIEAAMGMGSYIIGLFAMIFLIYSNSFLIKRRKKEFGLLQILGMEKKHLAKMMFFETVYLWVITVSAGILAGAVFYRMLFLVLLKLTRIHGTISFVLDGRAVRNTLLLAGLIFFVNFLLNLRQIHVSQPVALLHGEEQGEREPKTKWITALLGIVFLGIGYEMAVTCQSSLDALSKFFEAIVFVIVGTYCLFSAGSIALLKMLKKNKKFYYHPKHFTSVSSMLYRMKQNAAGLSNICILSTGVLLVISISTCLWAGMEEVVHTRFPHQILIQVNAGVSYTYERAKAADQEMLAALKDQVEEKLKAEQVNVTYENDQRYYQLLGQMDENRVNKPRSAGMASLSTIRLMEQSEYERITREPAGLKPDQVLVFYTEEKGFDYDTIVFGEKSYKVKKNRTGEKAYTAEQKNQADEILTVVFPDDETKAAFAAACGEEPHTYSWEYSLDLKGDAKEQIRIGKELEQLAEESPCDAEVEVRESQRDALYSIYGSILFLGVFVGVLFLMGAVMIIYYKQISEGFDDRRRFQIMQKVGMSRNEIQKTIKSQAITVFFLPLVVAAIHTMAAFPFTRRLMVLMNFNDTSLFVAATGITIAVFAVIYLIVYALTARAYYKIVVAD